MTVFVHQDISSKESLLDEYFISLLNDPPLNISRIL
jgi:hypothetical protein